MKLPNRFKNLKFRKGSEKGSVTLFVLIAMLFFLAIGMMIFIINMNTETSQKRDVQKIQSEYSGNNQDTDLEQKYQEAKQKQLGKFLLRLIDKDGNIYKSGEWINDSWEADENNKLLKVEQNYPEGIYDISVTITDNITGQTLDITNKNILEIFGFTTSNEGKYTIKNNLDETNKIDVNIDLTKPTVSDIAGGEVWIVPEGTNTDLGITITATDSNGIRASGMENGKIKYVVSSTVPDANTQWTTANGASTTVKIDSSLGEGDYYIYAIATDLAGNDSEMKTSGKIQVRTANYKITTGTDVRYAETLADAITKAKAASTTTESTIQVLRAVNDNSEATIDKTITLDTNGKVATMANTITVAANNTATFVGSGKVQRGTVASGDENWLINDMGTVIVDGATLEAAGFVMCGNGTHSQGTAIIRSGNVNCLGTNGYNTAAAIYVRNVRVSGGTISSNSSAGYGVVGLDIEITGGSISASATAICPSNGSLTISGNNTIISGNKAISHASDSHKNTRITISGGTISGTNKAMALYADNANVTITGGTITGATDGVSMTGAGSTLTIGNNENTLDRTNPVITGTSGYSVNMTGATSTFNFYDGKLVGGKKALASEEKRTFYGREMSFNLANNTTANFLTETEGNATRRYLPYTRENDQTHKFETVLEKEVKVTFDKNAEDATCTETERKVLTNAEYKELSGTAQNDASVTYKNLPRQTDLDDPSDSKIDRTGYTFKGWNGKNKFDYEEILRNNSSAVTLEELNGTQAISWLNSQGISSYKFLQGYFDEGKQYVFSGKIATSKEKWCSLRIYYTDGTFEAKLFYNLQANTWYDISFVSDPNKNVDYITGNYANNERIYIDMNSFQIEEGTTATAYEPYFVTDTTLVTQDTDHTLTAIWEANKYTVHFDKNDSQERPAVGEVADQEFVYGQAQNLNANEFVRIGYKFTGWNTAADGTGTPYTDGQSVSNLVATANGNITLYAQWVEANATFIPGEDFNVIAKKLAGHENATYATDDTAIAQIKYVGIGSGTDQISLETLKTIKANAKTPSEMDGDTQYVKVSVDAQSNTPIYVWFKDETPQAQEGEDPPAKQGKLYWFSEDDTPYTNASCVRMFMNLKKLTTIPEINKFNTSNTVNMAGMFYFCTELSALDVSGFNTEKVTNFGQMFQNCSSLSSLKINRPSTATTTATMNAMFAGCGRLTSLDVSGLYTQNVTTMLQMFLGCSRLQTLNVASFDTSKVTSFGQMFATCRSLTTLDLSNFDTTSVTTFASMFQNCTVLTSLKINRPTSGVSTTMANMFYGCSSLTSYNESTSTGLDLRGFHTESVKNMVAMFGFCSSLTSLDLSGFDTSSVTDFNNMFANCSGLTTLNLSGFNTSAATNMYCMFYGCSNLTSLDLRSFNTSSVTNLGIMFRYCSKLKTIYATDLFIVGNNTSTDYMFYGCSALEGGSGTKLNGAWVTNGSYAWIDGRIDTSLETPAARPGYFTNHYYVEFNKNDSQEAPATGTMETQGIPFSNATALRTNTFAREGYTFKGWSKTEGGAVDFTDGQSMNYDLNGIKAIAQNTADDKNVVLTLYAVWSENNYLNTTTSTYYDTLTSALAAIPVYEEGQPVQTIQVQNSRTETGTPTLAANKQAIIDLNGQTVTLNSTLTNNGTLTISDTATGGTITRAGDVITNNASTSSLTVNGGTITATSGYGIHNKSTGPINVNGGNISGPNGIYNDTNGTINVSGGTTSITGTNGQGIRGYTGSVNVSNGTISGTVFGISVQNASSVSGSVLVTGGIINSGAGNAIYNGGQGTVEIRDGSISSTSSQAIMNNSTGTITVSGGEISGKDGIYNGTNGTINVSGENTEVTGTNGQGIRGCTGSVNISNGTISGTTFGVSGQTVNEVSGSIAITGGSVTGGQHGLYAAGSSTITMGSNDSSVSKTSLEIISTATSGDSYGVYKDTNATFNFYDGKVTGKTGHSLNAAESAKPDGYQVVKRTADGKETAVLEKEVTVTFNPNPGETTGGTVSEESRKVLTNVEYQYNATTGTTQPLPTPTKTGYTFKGWNGKNLFDGTYSAEGKYINAGGRIGTQSNFNISNYINVKPNTSYVLSATFTSGTLGIEGAICEYDDNDSFVKGEKYDGATIFTFTTSSETRKVKLSYKTDASNYQLEEGTTATPYEPYYITSATPVTTPSNHTLTAIWDANQYTVTADANGGSITATNDWTGSVGDTTATKSVTFDSQYGALPTPTRVGYDFEGWTGKNLFNLSGRTEQPFGDYSNTTKRNFTGNGIYLGATANNYRQYVVSDYNIDTTNNNITVTSGSPGYGVGFDIKVKPNTEYSFSIGENSQSAIRIGLYKEDGTWISMPSASIQSFVKSFSFTTTADTYWLLLVVAPDNEQQVSTQRRQYNIQIEQGATATNFEPYRVIAENTTVKSAADHKIYANWTPKQYTVHFDANGGTPTPADKTVTFDSAYGAMPEVSKTGYTFKGWKINGEGDYITADTIVKTPNDHTLTAVWEATPFTVTLNAGDGTIDAGDDGWDRAGDNKTATKDITYDSAYGTLPNASRTGYTFNGWFTAAEGGTQITATTTMQTASAQTLYPHWTANHYTVHFDANGGTGTMSDQAFTYDQAQNLTANGFSKTGYSFAGWATSADGNVVHANEANVNNLTAENNATVNLYAVWTANNYTVTAKPNGGTLGTTADWSNNAGNTEATKTVTYDSAYGTLPTVENNGISRTGYTLAGWNGKNMFQLKETADWKYGSTTYNVNLSENSITINSGTDFRIVQYNLPVLKANTTYTISGNVELINRTFAYLRISKERAKSNGNTWLLNTTVNNGNFSVSFTIGNSDETTAALGLFGNSNDVSGGSGAIYSNIQIEEGSSATPFEPYYISTTTPVTTASNHNINAVWTANSYQVHFDANGGTGTMADQDFTYGVEQALTSNAFTRDGYSFMGWNTAANGSGNRYVDEQSVSNLTTVNNGIVTLYAQWSTFSLSESQIYLNKTTPTNMALIAPEGTEGAKVTYTGENIGELLFESENTSVATVLENDAHTQATVTTAASAQNGDSTKIIVKNRASGEIIGELNVIVDTEPPTWTVHLLEIQ